MIVVIVRWYIKKGFENDFESTWIKMDFENKKGLFREFLSMPVDINNEKYNTLDVESKHYTTFINVGVWKSIADFDEAIDSFIPGRQPDQTDKTKDQISLYKFEFKLRERIVMDVKTTREGLFEIGDSMH